MIQQWLHLSTAGKFILEINWTPKRYAIQKKAREEKKKEQMGQKENIKMADKNPTVAKITLNGNG